MMNIDYQPIADEIDEEDLEFEEALRARTRRRWIVGGGMVALIAALLVIPWSESIELSGRVAPARWARVRSEAPGVVREVRRRSGDPVQEGDVIAVLDSDEQRDAVEGARLALTREHQKLADLELRLRESSILREGGDAAVRDAERRATAASRIEDARLAELEPASSAVLRNIREFTIKARDQVAIAASSAPPFPGDEMLRAVEVPMSRYVERAQQIAAHLNNAVGDEAGRDFTARLENVRFNFGLARSSMYEIARKHEFVTRGLLAPVELRGLVNELEGESRDLGQSFDGLASAARGWKGSPTERHEWVRSAEEKRQLLENEAQRIEAEREAVASAIGQAELAVRAAERNEGKTAIHAPMSGTLAESALAELDGIAANAPVGVVEDTNQLVLKVHVPEADWPRVAEGQVANANVNGRMIRGKVAWKVPRLGQEVRDQQWNVLIRVDGDVPKIQPGTKINGAVNVGWRSLLWRWIDRRKPESASASAAALVDDPTERRSSADPGQLAARESKAHTASDASGLVGGVSEY
jgi:multidrug efflux pump subunit AcrA (membrane-fusion protein)